MLFTAHINKISDVSKKKVYLLLDDHGNDEVVPEQVDLDAYNDGKMTWKGFNMNYMSKLMRPEATRWMERVSSEAVDHDVVIVDDMNEPERSSRKLLADLMVNMFTGHKDMEYCGEISQE